jgi:hypothetical protein
MFRNLGNYTKRPYKTGILEVTDYPEKQETLGKQRNNTANRRDSQL